MIKPTYFFQFSCYFNFRSFWHRPFLCFWDSIHLWSSSLALSSLSLIGSRSCSWPWNVRTTQGSSLGDLTHTCGSIITYRQITPKFIFPTKVSLLSSKAIFQTASKMLWTNSPFPCQNNNNKQNYPVEEARNLEVRFEFSFTPWVNPSPSSTDFTSYIPLETVQCFAVPIRHSSLPTTLT